MSKKRMLTVALCLIMVAGLMPAGLIFPTAYAIELPQAGLNYDQYPALREVYKDYFLVGTIDRFNDAVRTEFMNYTYNAVTNENNMKPSSTQRNKGEFTFDSAYTSLNNATANISGVKLIGHTLTWHSQSPDWMWDAPNFDHDTALNNLNAHIDGVLGEFGGRLQAVDVVNEAIGTVNASNPGDWKTALDKGEGWALALGWEWVELAFVRAAKVVDENGWDCKLYYNDFGLEGTKAEAAYAMVKDINERYKGHRPNGKPLIEGVGIQGHFNMNTKMKDVEAAVALLATLPDVSLSFTELDVEYLNEGTLTPEQSVAQAQKYAQLFQICKNYAAGTANTTGNPKVVERVTFWGTDDGGSWKGTGLSTLFSAPNDEGQITAKEALLGALYPEEYLEKYPAPADEDDTVKYSVPGVYVYSLSRGDSWSGANIILGNDDSKWPWSTGIGGDDVDEALFNDVAFVPEKDAVYRLSVNYTALGTMGVRVRWIKDNTNGSYTAKDSQVVKTPPYDTNLSPNDVATMVPAHFNSGMVNAGTYVLVTEIKLDGSLPADDLIGNLAIRGSLGGNAYEINWIKMEKVGGDVMFVWDPNAPPEPEPEPEPEPQEAVVSTVPEVPVTIAPQDVDTVEPTDENNNTAIIVAIVLIIVLAAGVAAFFVIKRKKR